MRRILVLGVLLALAAATPSEARCRTVLESGEYRLGKTAQGWKLCGRGVTFGSSGRAVAMASRGDLVSVRFRDGDLTIIRSVHFRDGYASGDRTVLRAGERHVRQALGESVVYVAVGGRRPHIRALGGHPRGVIDRGVVPRSLRRRGGAVEWRSAGDRRRLAASDGSDVPPADCRVPSYANAVRRAGRTVAYELRLGDGDHEGAVFGCFGDGPPRKVGETGNDLVITSTTARLLAGPFGVFEHRSVWKDTVVDLTAFDLRTGQPTARADVLGGFMETVVSPTGAIAFSQRVADRVEILTARGEAGGTLDSGPEVDGRSLKLEGTTLSWVTGAQRRTAELP